jgi:hypothetical protein
LLAISHSQLNPFVNQNLAKYFVAPASCRQSRGRRALAGGIVAQYADSQ